MTAAREASIRLSLDGRQAQQAMGGLASSAKQVGGAIQGQFQNLASGIGSLTGLGAGFGFVSLTNQAMQTREEFTKLQFAVRAGSGNMVDLSRLQTIAAASSKNWSYGLGDLTKTMTGLYDASGNFEFMAQTIDTVAMSARASGESLQALGSLAGDLNEKFGISADGIGESMATIMSMSHKGGLTFADMGTYLNRVGAAAKSAGIQGEEGLRRLLGVTNFAEGEFGTLRQAMTAVQGVVTGIQSGDMQKQGMKVGVDIKKQVAGGAQFEDVLIDLVAGTKGSRSKALESFGSGPTGLLIASLADLFKEAGGGDAGRKKLKQSFDELSRSAMSVADMQRQATERNEDPKARFDKAMAALEEAMQGPEVTNAIQSFTKQVPAMGAAMAKFIELAGKDPALAGALTGVGAMIISNPAALTIVATGAVIYEQAKALVDESNPEIERKPHTGAAAVQRYKGVKKEGWASWLMGDFEDPGDAWEYSTKRIGHHFGIGSSRISAYDKKPQAYQYEGFDGREHIETIGGNNLAIAYGGNRFQKSSRDNAFALALSRAARRGPSEQDEETGRKRAAEKLPYVNQGPMLPDDPWRSLREHPLGKPGRRPWVEPAPSGGGGGGGGGGGKPQEDKALMEMLRSSLGRTPVQEISASQELRVIVVNIDQLGAPK